MQVSEALMDPMPHRLCYPYGVPRMCHEKAQWETAASSI
jgi:hypothetical protein